MNKFALTEMVKDADKLSDFHFLEYQVFVLKGDKRKSLEHLELAVAYKQLHCHTMCLLWNKPLPPDL